MRKPGLTMQPTDPAPRPSPSPRSQDQIRWDQRYRAGACPGGGEVSAWVKAQAPYLNGGLALDVACGAGRHALWLAELGYRVDAVDISREGLNLLLEQATARALSDSLNIIQADLNHWRPDPNRYDLILVTRYLNRQLWPALQAALKPGGLFLHRTFHTDVLRQRPDFDRDHLLQPGELLAAFRHWCLLAYEERRWYPGGDWRDCTASILVRKPE
ncbi:MAG: class I SAM-dependent methyltransferase [Caldilineae bacterium]|nr:MAG: class I SAM-dependent methyltransferase [Caldilineae bacterium]